MKNLKKVSVFSLFFVLGMLFFSTTSNAYIDPSAMTYIVQVVVGIVIAGGAAFAFYFKKIKRKLKRKVDDAKIEDYDTKNDVEFDDEFDNIDDDFDESSNKE
ncbi:MAG: hypothetical protein RR585_05525 [Coprobacillus sp.]